MAFPLPYPLSQKGRGGLVGFYFEILYFHTDFIKRVMQIFFDCFRLYSQNVQAQHFKNILSSAVCVNLIIMDGAIHFNNQAINRIIKINDKIAYRLLPPKFDTVQFLSTQSLP